VTVIYEPFDMPTGALSGQAGGIGLGTWSGTGGVVASGSMSFGSLPASGNKYTGTNNNYNVNWAGFSTTLSSAGLLDHGAELWFSVLLQPATSANDYGFVGLSSATGNLSANFGTVPAGANIMGIWLQNGSDLQLVDAVNGAPVGGRDKVIDNLSLTVPTLVVGKFTWGADGASNDTLQIYLPGTNLVQPASPTGPTMTTVIDQSTFGYLGVWMRNVNSQVDEIRFGATYGDVIATVITTPAYWDLNGTTAGAGGPAPNGTWNTANENWNVAADGVGTGTVSWAAGRIAVFSAGSDATGTYTVTVDWTQDIGGLIFQGGTVTLAPGTGGALRMTGDNSMDVASGLTATVETPISENVAGRRLTKMGGGTLILSGANTYTGGTTVGAGILRLGAANVLPDTGAVTVAGDAAGVTATLDLNGNNDTIASLTLGGWSTTSGAAVTTGAAALTLGGNVTYNSANNPLGATISGKLDLGTADRTFTVNDSATAADDLTVSADISGTGVGLIKEGAGTLVLSGNNVAATGGMTISGGVTRFESTASINGTLRDVTVNSGAAVMFGSSFGAGAVQTALADRIVTSSGGAIAADNYGGENFDFDTLGFTGAYLGAVGNVSYTGTLTPNATGGWRLGGGGGTLTFNQSATGSGYTMTIGGNVILSGANDYTGATTVSAGTLGLTGSLTGGTAITTSGTGILNESATGVISGAASITQNSSGTSILSGANTYTGATTIKAGVLQANNATALGGGGDVTFAGGTLQYTAASAGQDWAARIKNSTGAVRLDTNGQTVTLGGIIDSSNTAGLVKLGAGTLTLSNNNTYTGGTTVDAGTLVLSGSNSTSGVTLNAATLIIGNAGALGAGTFTIAGAGTVQAAGTIITTNTVAANSNFTIAGTGALTLGDMTLSAARTITNSNITATTTFGAVFGSTTLTLAGNGSTAVTGSIATGAGGLTKGGTGTLSLTNANSYYSGVTTITAGVLEAAFLANGGLPSSIGISTNAAASLVFGAPAATLRYIGSSSVTINRGFTLSSGAGGGATIESSGGGTLSIDNTVALAYGTAAQTRLLTLGGTNTGANTFSKVIGDNTTAATSLTKAGTGTWILSGANTYSGATTVNAGTLVISGSPTGTGAVRVNGGTLDLGGGTASGSLASTVLSLGGGTFAYTRTGNTTQGFSTTNISGLPAISVASGNILNLGAIANTGGTIDFAGTGAGIVAADTASNIGGIIPGATFGNTWAVANGADIAITGLAAYTLTSDAGTTAGNYTDKNIDANSSEGTLSDVITPNSLRFNTPGANTVTLAAGANTITSGGILVTGDVGDKLSTITGGTLAGAASASLIVIQNNSSAGLTIASDVVDNTGATTLTKAGAGLLTLTGAGSTYTGATAVLAGTLQIAGAGSLGAAGIYAGNITNNGTFLYSSSADQTLSGIISGAGSLTKDTDSSSTLTLSGANSFTGAVAVNAGTLALSPAGALNMGNTFTGAGTLNINPAAANNLTLSGDLSGFTGTINIDANTGVAKLAQTGAFTLGSGAIVNIASGATWFIGNTTAQAGVTANIFGMGNTENMGALHLDNGTIAGSSSVVLKANGSVGGNGAANTGTINAVISEDGGSFSLTKQGTATTVLGGSNTYTGATVVSAGTLTLSNSLALQNSALDTLNSATGGAAIGLKTTVTTLTLGGLTGNKDLASVFTTTAGGYSGVTALTLNPGTGKTPSYSGIIADGATGMTLTKTGLGMQTLSGANTYTGATLVSGGRLQLDGLAAAGTLATSGLTVGAGATLGFTAGTASTLNLTGKPFSLGGTVALDIGASGVNDALTVGDFTLTGNSALTFNLIGGITNGATYTLLTSANPIVPGIFSITGQTSGRLTLTLTINAKTVTLTSGLDEGSWNNTVGGDWSDAGNWTGYKPTAVGDAPLFGLTIAAPANIAVDTPQTVGYMRFDNATNAYTIGATGSSNLTLDNGAFNAVVAVNSGSHIIAENVALTSNTVVAPASGATLTVSGSLSGAGGVSLSDAGTLVLSAVNTYTGATAINAGTLKIGGAGSLGTAGAYAGNITNNGTFLYSSSANQTLSGIISGAGSLTKDTSSSSTLTLSGANTYSGGTTITAGKVIASSGTALGAAAVSVAGGATLQLNNTVVGDTQLNITNAISGAGTLEFSGANVVTNDNRNRTTIVLSGFTGDFSILANGNFTYDASNATSNQSITIASGGFLSLPTGNANFGALNGTGTICRNRSADSTATLIVGNGDADGAFSGIIRGIGIADNDGGLGGPGIITLTKVGAGTLTLSGANIYVGPTAVSGGTLLVNGDQSLATGAVTVASGATLGGTGKIGGAVTVNGTLAPGAAGIGMLTVGTGAAPKNVTMAATAIYNFDITSPTNADTVNIMGTGIATFDTGWQVVLSNGGGGAPQAGDKFYLFSYDAIANATTLVTPAFSAGTTGWIVTGASIGKDSAGVFITGIAAIVPGDTNGDRLVDAADFINLKKNFGTSTGAGVADGDFNASNTVDWGDLGILMSNMGAGGGAPATAPEPATLGLLAIGALAMLRRNRRS
jgi:autotransporter-associated beta strand protein